MPEPPAAYSAVSGIPDDFLAVIGKIMVRYAYLELVLGVSITVLLRVDQRTANAITSELAFRNLVGLCDSLFRHRYKSDTADIETLEQLLNKAIAVQERRNQVAHSLWGYDAAGGMLMRLKITAKKGRGVKHSVEALTLQELDEIATETDKVSRDLVSFILNKTGVAVTI